MRRDWNQLTRLPHGGTIFPAIFTGLLTPSRTRCEPRLERAAGRWGRFSHASFTPRRLSYHLA
jgi:hypothetical protein